MNDEELNLNDAKEMLKDLKTRSAELDKEMDETIKQMKKNSKELDKTIYTIPKFRNRTNRHDELMKSLALSDMTTKIISIEVKYTHLILYTNNTFSMQELFFVMNELERRKFNPYGTDKLYRPTIAEFVITAENRYEFTIHNWRRAMK